jgi:hypothetical protein
VIDWLAIIIFFTNAESLVVFGRGKKEESVLEVIKCLSVILLFVMGLGR